MLKIAQNALVKHSELWTTVVNFSYKHKELTKFLCSFFFLYKNSTQYFLVKLLFFLQTDV